MSRSPWVKRHIPSGNSPLAYSVPGLCGSCGYNGDDSPLPLRSAESSGRELKSNKPRGMGKRSPRGMGQWAQLYEREMGVRHIYGHVSHVVWSVTNPIYGGGPVRL